jgi:long-chain acyl-CoA synthetase
VIPQHAEVASNEQLDCGEATALPWLVPHSGRANRPWLLSYGENVAHDITPPTMTGLDLFRAAVRTGADKAFLRYFAESVTYAETDRMSDRLAQAFAAAGVGHGDRVALYLQNTPHYPIAVIAAWKLAAVVVPINPMLRPHEVDVILGDSGAKSLLCLESLHSDVVPRLQHAPGQVITASELDFGVDHPAVLFHGVRRTESIGAARFLDIVNGPRDRAFVGSSPVPEDLAFLTYTSGTTGPPKGAMNLHRNITFMAETHLNWMGLQRDDIILTIAPLFHITGVAAHLAPALRLGATLVLGYRFHPATVARLIQEERATYTVAAITAFIALANDPEAARYDLSSLRKVYSGGAPIPPSVVARWQERTATYIHNVYGLTEASGGTHAVPLGASAPVDPRSGALSIGLPLNNTTACVIDEKGTELPPGHIGELVVSGPQFVPGYWAKPADTAATFTEVGMRTGDVGFMDADGWFFVVDRKKDLIIASGYKVWPRDVEDVLYTHPAVREAAVIGVPDEIRGETVKAFISLRDGMSATETEIIAHCREHLAAYKYPRSVEILDELPKTTSGKVLRRALRAD